jgi:hypothetical protein
MLLSSESVMVVALPSSEISEGLMNYSVYKKAAPFKVINRSTTQVEALECAAFWRPQSESETRHQISKPRLSVPKTNASTAP